MDKEKFSNQVDRRIIFSAGPKLELAAATAEASAPSMTLRGYPIVWNQLSDDRGGYKVRLLPGSANFATPTLALYYHNFASPIGNTGNNTLRLLPADAYGVPVEIDLADTTTGRDVAALVARKDVQGMSFSMLRGFDYEETEENGLSVINVARFDSDEVSVLVNPGFVGTKIEPKPAEQQAAKNLSADEKELQAMRLKLESIRLFGLTLG